MDKMINKSQYLNFKDKYDQIIIFICNLIKYFKNIKLCRYLLFSNYYYIPTILKNLLYNYNLFKILFIFIFLIKQNKESKNKK